MQLHRREQQCDLPRTQEHNHADESRNVAGDNFAMSVNDATGSFGPHISKRMEEYMGDYRPYEMKITVTLPHSTIDL